MTITPELVTAFFGGLLSIFVALVGFNKWIIGKFLSELRPNGGGSIKDKVDINTERLSRVEERVDSIYLLLAKRSKNG